MRVSLNWLKEFVDLPTADIAQLTRAFDYLGHTVEEVVEYAPEWTGVVVGRVERIEAHPDADNVRVTHVDLGDGELHQIICGAWNFDEGAVVPVAVPGAVLPGDFAIGRRKIRGVESNGMICSESELGLGEDHEGIMVLDPATPIGVPFETLLDFPDVVFDLEITNNRPDVMGMEGVARELAAWFDVPFTERTVEPVTVPGDSSIAITNSAPDGCNRFTAREVRGVTIGRSPLWLRERLRRCGVRAISNVVDVTNYVMMELGHPLHAFDADAIAGDLLDVRWAVDGETIETLDGALRTLTPSDLVIADAEGPTSLAAVMGGARSEVTATTGTVLMEAANWDRATVMYTSRRHDLQSEASKRFERGVDVNLAVRANDRACELLVELAGGEILDGQVDIATNPIEPWQITLTLRDVHRLLGDRFTIGDTTALLRRLGLAVEEQETAVVTTIPTNRGDLTRPADLVEEIARLADFDTFDATVPTGPAGGLDADQRRAVRVRRLLSGMGLHQAINLPFVAPAETAAFGGRPDLDVTVRNPLRDDQAKLRQQLLPGLLRNVRDNRNRGAATVALFETGRVFLARPWSHDDRVPDQPVRLGIVVSGAFGPSALNGRVGAADAATALALIETLAAALGVDVARSEAAPAGFHPTRTAALTLGTTTVGHAGEVHPDVLEMFGIEGRVAAIEVDLEPLLAPTPAPLLGEVSTYPHVDFDLSFSVPPGLSGVTLLDGTRAAARHLEWARVFDDYRTSEGRAIGIRYRLRATDHTLDRDEIAGERAAMIEAASGLGATLRGGSDA